MPCNILLHFKRPVTLPKSNNSLCITKTLWSYDGHSVSCNTHTHTYTPFNRYFPREPGPAGCSLDNKRYRSEYFVGCPSSYTTNSVNTPKARISQLQPLLIKKQEEKSRILYSNVNNFYIACQAK